MPWCDERLGRGRLTLHKNELGSVTVAGVRSVRRLRRLDDGFSHYAAQPARTNP